MSEPARIEQVITEFFAKSLRIILEVRSPYVNSSNYSTSSSSSSMSRVRAERSRDYPSTIEDFDLCRQSNLEPLVIDVVLIHMEHKSEKIVERWFVQYKSRKSSNVARQLHFGDRRSGGHSPKISSYKKIYKDTVILLRSLYSTIRLLPAYKVFENLKPSACVFPFPFSLSHRISSFAEPFTRAEEAEMHSFSFTPVETVCGRLSLSVLYVITLEAVEPSRPVSAQFIPDYVGSPRTERLKRLSGGSLPSIRRRHSWSIDGGITPYITPFPSPTHSDSHTMQCSQNPDLPLRSHPPDHFPSTPLAHKKKLSLNQYGLSPPFSPSSSPSPPTNLPNIQVQKDLLRAKSAPLSAPLLRLREGSGLVNQALSPSHGPQATTCSRTSPERKLHLKKRLGDVFSGMNLQKILYCGKDEFRNLYGRKMSSCSSLQIPTRSSSRLSLLNEFDDTNFVCPFACDDEDSRGMHRYQWKYKEKLDLGNGDLMIDLKMLSHC